MDDAVSTLVGPDQDVVGPDVSEARLRDLYRHRPGTVRLGLVRSADGGAAGPDGSSRSLSGPADARIMQVLRAVADVVLVGAQTARRERYADITLPEPLAATRTGYRHDAPDLAIVTRSGILPGALDPSRTWVVTTAGSRASALDGPWASRIIVAGADDFSPRTVVHELEARGLARILCEGGPTVAARVLRRGLIDDYCLTTSPAVAGHGAPQIPEVPAGMRLAHRLTAGDFIFERHVTR